MSRYKNIQGIIPKHSSVKDKLPTAAQLETAEIAVNINSESPFISVKCNDGSVKKITADGGYVVVSELPASGKSGVVYALETVIVDPDEGSTYYSYDLYIYEQDNWRKVGETTEPLTAGENITIVNNKISADQVIDITQSDYDNLPASAKTSSAIYNITDKSVLNVDEYQKKLVAGDFISIDAIHNTIDCTLDPNLYVMVNALPAEGTENKIYLVKVTNPDTTVSFEQYGWINDEWVEYGKTSNLQPNVAGSGITIDSNNAINAKLGNGLTMDANSAITADLGAGLTMDGNKIVPNIAAPLIKNASNQLSVSSSSTYTSTGTELFTRAGAYSMYSSVGQEVTVSYEINTTYVNSVSYCKAYKIFPNLDFYYLGMVVRVKDVPAQTEVTMLNNVKINGKVPANETMKRQSLNGAMQRDTAPCGLIWKAEGENKVYFHPATAVPSGGDNCIITAFLWLPRTAS